MNKNKTRNAIAVTVWGESYLVKNILYSSSGITCAQIDTGDGGGGMLLTGREIILLAKVKTNTLQVPNNVKPGEAFFKWWRSL